ncbi:hypothetical protein RUM43_005147 [Polyplax serrata]|uniref:Protein phosphatase 1 regulatory subunit 42 n=1 Tax=Polyplax serrata TaxID=468196 RepID=A0AAN8SBR9_POLSC
MVKLNTKYLIKRNKANKHFLTRKKGDSNEDFLKAVTHLPLQNQFIEEILKMEHCTNLKVLYLQCNLLRNMNNLDNFPNLTHLYLQRNFLVKIENLEVLPKLKKIYLGHNEIQVLEGMDKIKQLKEIHFECQDLSPGETIYFEPLTIRNLGESLQVLNISNNYLESIHGIKCLHSLRVLTAQHNYLSDLEDLTCTISEWNFLRELNLIGNDVTKNKRYLNAIIFASRSLEILDGSPIHPNTRIYVEELTERMKNFKSQKEKKTEGPKVTEKALKLADTFTHRLAFAEPLSEIKSVFFLPVWKLRKNLNSTNPIKFLPRPYWQRWTPTCNQNKFDY